MSHFPLSPEKSSIREERVHLVLRLQGNSTSSGEGMALSGRSRWWLWWREMVRCVCSHLASWLPEARAVLGCNPQPRDPLPPSRLRPLKAPPTPPKLCHHWKPTVEMHEPMEAHYTSLTPLWEVVRRWLLMMTCESCLEKKLISFECKKKVVSTLFHGKGWALVFFFPSGQRFGGFSLYSNCWNTVYKYLLCVSGLSKFEHLTFGFGFRMFSHSELLFYLYMAINQHSPNSFLFIIIIRIYCHFLRCWEVVRITARLWRKASRASQAFWGCPEGQCCCWSKDSATKVHTLAGLRWLKFPFPIFSLSWRRAY